MSLKGPRLGALLRQPVMRRNMALAGALLLVVVVFSVAQNSLVAASQPPVLPQNSSQANEQALSSDDGYFLKDYAQFAEQSEGQPWWALVTDVTIKLAIVLGLVYGAARLLRRYAGAGRFGSPASGASIRVLESNHLAPNRSLYLIGVGHKVLLVGATPGHLTTLTEIIDPAEVAQLRPGESDQSVPGQESGPSSKSFQQLLSTAIASEDNVEVGMRVVPDPLVESRDFLMQKITEIRRITSGFPRG